MGDIHSKTWVKNRGLLLTVISAALISNILIIFLPVKLILFSILGVILIGLALINPFIVLLFMIIVKVINFSLSIVSVGFVEVGLNKILGGFLIVILLMESILKKNFGFLRPLQTKLIFCFLLVAFASSVFAEEKDIALLQAINYLTGFLIYLLLVSLIKSKRQVGVLISVLIASGVLMVLLEVSAMHGLIPYKLSSIAEGEEYRFGSFYAQPNKLAIHLAVLTPLVVFSFLRFKSLVKKAFIILILIMFLAVVFLTASRSGVLVLAFALLLLFILKRKHVVLWFFLFLLLAAVLAFIPAEYLTRLSTLKTLPEGGSSPEPNIALRFDFIKVGLMIFLNNPVFGAGPGNYDYRIVEYGLERKPAHNAYVSVLAEMGLTGFIIYLLLYYVVFTDYLKTTKTLSRVDPELKNMTESLFMSFLVFAVGQMAHVAVIDTNFVTLIGLSVVLKKIAVTPLCGSSTRTK